MRANVPGSEPFRAGRFAVLRLAALLADDAELSRTDFDLDDAGAATRYLRRLAAEPKLREAIEVSTGSLAGVLNQVEAGADVPRKKRRRAVLAATRYLLRMTSRPTPFGLFAGVCLVRFDETAKVRLGDHDVKQVRPDAEWSHALVRRLQRLPGIRDDLLVVVNNLCEILGDRLVMPYLRHLTQDTPGRQLSVAYTPVVRAATSAARFPVYYRDLRERLLGEFPDATAADADRLLLHLLEREILLSDLAADLTSPDRFDRLLGLVNDRDEPEARELLHIAAALADYREKPAGQGLAAWRTAVARLSALQPTEKPPIQVDLRADADIQLPRAIADEVAHVAGVLWRLAPAGDGLRNLRTYQRDFRERYGVDRLVPVLELLDPQRGLGPPGGYQNPPAERSSEPKPPDPYPVARDEHLAAAMADVGAGELVVDDALVALLAGDPSSGAGDADAEEPPDSIDVCVQVFAESVEAFHGGAYTLAISPGAGSLTAGAMSGRFAALLGAEDLLAELFQPKDAADPSRPLPAQLLFQPTKPRFGNVISVPLVLPHRVPVGCFDDPGAEQVIDVRELAVGATYDRLYLFAPKLGRTVHVTRPHMLNLDTGAPNVARFLAEVGMSGARRWAPWLWGRLAVLPRLPRVRYGRTVLSPAQWRPDPRLSDRRLTWPEWQQVLADWRLRAGVPSAVRVNVYDNYIELDLDSGLHQRVLRDHLQRVPRSPVWESQLAFGSLGWCGGRSNELVVPVVATRPRSSMSTGARKVEPVRYQPGGEWLYAKVYLIADLHDGLLVSQVRRLVDAVPAGVDRWFFVRYRDPDAHLRLRFHGPAAELRGSATKVLHEWSEELATAGLIGKVELDGYEPELARYGGGTAMPYAERLFHADSEAVLGQLEMRAKGELNLPIETLAAMNYVELLGSLGRWDWPAWFLAAYPIELSNEIPAGERQSAVRLIDPTRCWQDLPDIVTPDTADRLRRLWRERAAVAEQYGQVIGVPEGPDRSQRSHGPALPAVLHMHANRLIGLNRETERRSYGLLRAALRGYVDERRHGHE